MPEAMIDGDGNLNSVKFGVIIPTYFRDDALHETLQAISRQSVTPTVVVVVDNASREATKQICDDVRGRSPFRLLYHPMADNTGPAGATSAGMAILLATLTDSDYIVRGDDDSPDVRLDHFELSLQAAERALALWPQLGGVGGSGSRFEPRTAQLFKPPSAKSGLTPVDYLATNFYPFFRVAAVRQAGLFRDDLFFGHDEVEYGLRLRSQGFALVRWEHDEFIRRHAPASWRVPHPTWRRYYSIRNQLVIAREYGAPLSALRVAAVALAKPIANLPLAPNLAVRNFALAWRAVFDGASGRMGRRVEPRVSSGQLDERS